MRQADAAKNRRTVVRAAPQGEALCYGSVGYGEKSPQKADEQRKNAGKAVKTGQMKRNMPQLQNSIEKTVFQAILGSFSGKLLKGERILQQTGETPR